MVISNRRIFGDEGYALRNGVSAWTWSRYYGENPHDMHVHVSVNASDALADDTQPWVIGDIASAEHPTLKLGDSGEVVKEAQSRLGSAVNGVFDGAMDSAVRTFQARSGLRVDGIIGPYTWRALLADHLPDAGGGLAGLSTETINAILASAALVMAAPNSGNDNTDALSWYNSDFHAIGMSNAVAGLNTLRHLFVLLFGLGMRESSGNCFEGRDISASNTSSETAEAGLFQQSYNSFSASPDLLN